MIQVIFQVRKDEFRDHEAVLKELDLVEEEDQFTHLITIDDAKDSEDILNVFKFDSEYEATEEKYSSLRKEILDEGSSSSESGSGLEEESDSEEESENGKQQVNCQ
jgi:pre-mRNA-splicing factor CWC22